MIIIIIVIIFKTLIECLGLYIPGLVLKGSSIYFFFINYFLIFSSNKHALSTCIGQGIKSPPIELSKRWKNGTVILKAHSQNSVVIRNSSATGSSSALDPKHIPWSSMARVQSGSTTG